MLLPSPPTAATDGFRSVCYRCHKPEPLCICATIPRVDNRTPVFILQHPRERFHPIGTARIARLGLGRVELAVFSEHARSRPPFDLPPGAGVLYPAPGARRLDELDESERPSALVVLDGTWHHARTLFRDHPWLHDLPRYSLEPRSPSRYRIRREPRAGCVSTIEAIAEALSLLEPETAGLDALLGSFDGMIDAQIEQTRSRRRGRRVERRRREWHAIPRALVEDFERLWIVYGESAQATRRGEKQRALLQWTAVSPHSGQSFERIVRPTLRMPDERHLEHMGLEREAVEGGIALDQLCEEWAALTAGCTVAAWNQSTLDLLQQLGHGGPTLLLKAVYCNVERSGAGTLESVIAAENLDAEPAPVRGRAAERLGNAVTIARHLRERAVGR